MSILSVLAVVRFSIATFDSDVFILAKFAHPPTLAISCIAMLSDVNILFPLKYLWSACTIMSIEGCIFILLITVSDGGTVILFTDILSSAPSIN